MKISILNAEPDGYSRNAREILRSLGRLHEEKCSRSRLLEIIHHYDVLITRLHLTIDNEILLRAVNLKWIVSATTGLDHIDIPSCKKQGVEVLSLKGEVKFLKTVSSTAEHTWGLLLSLMRHIPFAFDSVIHNKWDRDAFRGNELSGKNIGIVGLGRLGEKIAGYAKAFDMKIYAYDPYRHSLIKGVQRCKTLEELLKQSDVLSVHVPLNKETYHLIGKRELSMLPNGAWFLNTSRGDIVDSSALLQSLKKGHLSGAAVDVIDSERIQPLSHHQLVMYARKHQNLIITPHIGGATKESMEKTEIFMAEKLKKAMGEKCRA